MKVKEELSLIEFIKKEYFSRKNLNQLIEHCFRISRAHVSLNYRRIRNINESHYISVDDIAIEAISHLFILNEKRGKLNIFLFLDTWETEINDEDDAKNFFRKVVRYSVEQQINYLLKQNNPNFSKILDKVKYQIKKYGFHKLRVNGAAYITKKPVEKCQILDYQTVAEILIHLDGACRQFDLEEFFLVAEKKYVNPAVSLNDLANNLDILENPTSKSETPASYMSEYVIEDILARACGVIEREVQTSYYEKGKLDKKEVRLFTSALKLVVQDLQYGHKATGLKKYFTAANHEVSEKEYESKYHNIFEYLVKKLKTNLNKYLECEV